MINFILYAQLIVLILNIMVFIYLMNERSVNYRRVRIMLLISISIGIIVNIGKVTWLTVLFSFTPFISLININEHGKFYRYIKRVGDSIRGNKQSGKNLQRHSKAVYNQKA